MVERGSTCCCPLSCLRKSVGLGNAAASACIGCPICESDTNLAISGRDFCLDFEPFFGYATCQTSDRALRQSRGCGSHKGVRPSSVSNVISQSTKYCLHATSCSACFFALHDPRRSHIGSLLAVHRHATPARYHDKLSSDRLRHQHDGFPLALVHPAFSTLSAHWHERAKLLLPPSFVPLDNLKLGSAMAMHLI